VFSLHSIRARGVAAFQVAPLAVASAQQLQPPPSRAPASTASSFTIFLKGVPIGTEQVELTRSADGWTILSSGRTGPPIDIEERRVLVRYSPDWKPLELTVDITVRGQAQSLHTTIDQTTAKSELSVGDQTTQKSGTIDSAAILLPNPFFGPYEALSARLRTAATAGSTIPAYAPPQLPLVIQVGDSSSEQIQTPGHVVNARRTHLTVQRPGLPSVDVEMWYDETGRLLRISVPAQNLEVVREDIASVASRRVTVSRLNDEQIKIAANGFSLAATVSKPDAATGKPLPAIVLVAGSGPTDRDELVFNIPIFGYLSSALTDAGYLVVRYDKRGIGQSGGRAESATLADFADDLRAVVKYVGERKDVDRRHLAVVGHSEGGSVAMIAGTKEKQIAALVLVATIGVTGADLNLEQVTRALDRSGKSDAEKQATVDLQKKIQKAVITGTGWDAVPPALRKQADTPWFQSFLAFDPAKVMPELRQPILIVQGELDTQVPPSNADRLETLARARKHAPPVAVVKVPGVNHLLVQATTGEYDEYHTLTEKRISPAVASAITGWLETTFANTAK
jgi:pimeloyl-ACP methyl ester carboxylesterase